MSDAAAIVHPAYGLTVAALCLAAASLLAWASPFYRGRIAARPAGRHRSIDGLRGYLALAVFGTHAVNMYSLHALGQWSPAGTTVYSRAAEAGVSLFFMITAFLFWQRVLGERGGFDARGFLAGRVRRLLPMYLFSVALVLVVVFTITGPVLRGGPERFLADLVPWLSLGFVNTGALNGLADARAVNAVYWTLAYEWKFYLALPLLALLAGNWRLAALALVTVALGAHAPIYLNFLFGALAAEAVQRGMLRGRLGRPAFGVLAAGILAVVLGVPFESVYAPLPLALLFVFFLFIVDGNSLLGLLRSPGSQLMGMTSYSLYLLHCIALFAVVRAADGLVPVASLGAGQYWSLAALAAVLAVAASTVTFRYVELAFLRPRAPVGSFGPPQVAVAGSSSGSPGPR